MALPRSEVVPGLLDELERFEVLVRPLGPTEWAAPSRCAGWTVADVAAHVAGTLADITAGRFDDLVAPEHVARQVAERRGRSAAEAADELTRVRKLAGDLLGALDDRTWLLPAPGGIGMSNADGVEALWYDAYIHADDVRAALGRPSEKGPGLRGAVSHLAYLLDRQGWGPATLVFDGIGRFDVSGGGREITGDAHEFVLAGTGRLDPAAVGLDETVNVYRER